MRYEEVSEGVTMADAHGFTQMVDYIEGRYSPDEWTFVSPGASADPMLCVMIVPSD